MNLAILTAEQGENMCEMRVYIVDLNFVLTDVILAELAYQPEKLMELL